MVDLLCGIGKTAERGANASSQTAVRENLVRNILGPNSGVRLILAIDGERAVGLASIALLYPAPKEQGQLFMKELYVLSEHRETGLAVH